MKIKIFVVSLKHSKDRRKLIQSQMKKYGLKFEFIDAVDGNNLTEQQKNMVHTNKLSNAEIGCSMSHANIYEIIVKQKIQHSIIFEDDIIFTEDFKTLIEKNILQNDDNGLIMLYHMGAYTFWGIKPSNFFEDYKLISPISTPATTACYYLNYECAKKLYDVTRIIEKPADWPMDLKELNVKCIVPRIVKHPPRTNTTIGTPSNSKIKNIVVNIVDKERESALYSILASIGNIPFKPISSFKSIMMQLFFKTWSPKT